jgi:xylan 1,4-beta-xylosidase
VEAITHWAFYFEGKRWFEGNRTLFDNDNVEKPIVNGLRFLERLAGGEQIALETNNPSVGGIAVRRAGESDRLLLLLWHHEDPWWIDGDAALDLTVTLPEGTTAAGTTITRLDANHANTYRVWESLGGPQDPTPEQIAEIHAAATFVAEPLEVESRDGTVTARTTIPLHGLALLEIPLNPAT